MSKRNKASIGPPQRRVLMVGVAGCGKTTLLYHLHLGKTIATVPTLGYNVETLTINGIELTIWDVGGDWNYRNGLWHHYIPQADGIIFVVDSSDESQIDAVKTVLCELYRDFESQLKRSVLLVFANKQDRLNALSVAEVKDRIGIERETMQAEGRRWHVQGSIATTGDGLLEGMVWMTMQMN
ncbi:ADP-ribosylation factor [Linnemannia elongata]|nr:ADP-ribosylation factor [Linnemannia elongata]